mmetsp:Transcript_107632/g.303131  ORF Transcript_107632/g.303131 Transcript_107632/m.303131 type:complete len:517 (-) Transcript_107632:115-1665(-)
MSMAARAMDVAPEASEPFLLAGRAAAESEEDVDEQDSAALTGETAAVLRLPGGASPARAPRPASGVSPMDLVGVLRPTGVAAMRVPPALRPSSPAIATAAPRQVAATTADGGGHPAPPPLRDSFAGRLLLRMFRGRSAEQLEGLRTNRARRILGQLRRYAICSGCFATLSVLVATWLIVRGSMALAFSDGAECHGYMREWLRSFMWLQFSGPASIPPMLCLWRINPNVGKALLQLLWPLAAAFLVGWCIVAVVYVRPPLACPALRGLTSEALALQIITLLLMAIAGMYLLAAVPLVARLKEIVSRGGVISEAAGLAAEVPNNDAPASEECVICLGCMEDEEDVECEGGGHAHMDPEFAGAAQVEVGLRTCEDMEDSSAAAFPKPPKVRPKWRRLCCGHQFHEQCLFEWLRKAKRCPICRCHMREVRGAASPSAPASAAAGARELLGGDGGRAATAGGARVAAAAANEDVANGHCAARAQRTDSSDSSSSASSPASFTPSSLARPGLSLPASPIRHS